MRGSIVGWGGLTIALLGAAPALATHHSATSHKTTHHGTTHHGKAATHHTVATKHTARHAETGRKQSAPSGATSIPGGGLKVYCGPGKNPLMIRKMTQGNGTTVTVVCR